jgi:polyisoprenyl-phosphate glycosyltransferase
MEIIYSIIIPVFNEELVIAESYKRLTTVMKSTNENYELIFVNDGSNDKSEQIINNIYEDDKNIKLISFSRNFGHQPAITAGMAYAKGKAVIIIDADLQDPPHVILDMIVKWKEGYDVVYGKRSKRPGESYFKKISAKVYYRLLKRITNVDIPVDTGDFRLIDRKVCDAMNNLQETNRYVRGLVSWVGFRKVEVEFNREGRFAGKTKYSLKNMMKFAIDGITSFSYAPLKISSYLGVCLCLFALIYLLIDKNFDKISMLITIVLLSQGMVLLVLGLIGQYMGRIYDEIKNRPIYIVEKTIGYENDI